MSLRCNTFSNNLQQWSAMRELQALSHGPTRLDFSSLSVLFRSRRTLRSTYLEIRLQSSAWTTYAPAHKMALSAHLHGTFVLLICTAEMVVWILVRYSAHLLVINRPLT